MTNQEKIKLLEEMLDVREKTLNRDMILEDIEEWDSMAKISLIVLMDEKFGKELAGTQIREFKTVQDIIDFME